MISSDQNIENIANFVEEAKEWFSVRKEYTKLDIIDKVVRISTVIVLIVVFAVLIMLALIYLSFATAYLIDGMIDNKPLAFLCVSAFYVFLLIVFYLRRHSWIEQPLVRFLFSILMNNNKA